MIFSLSGGIFLGFSSCSVRKRFSVSSTLAGAALGFLEVKNLFFLEMGAAEAIGGGAERFCGDVDGGCCCGGVGTIASHTCSTSGMDAGGAARDLKNFLGLAVPAAADPPPAAAFAALAALMDVKVVEPNLPT